MDHLASNGIGSFAATIREGHAASEGVAHNLGLRVTDEVIQGERVWRADTSLGSGPSRARSDEHDHRSIGGRTDPRHRIVP